MDRTFDIIACREAAYALSAYVSPPADWKLEPPFVSNAARTHPVTMIELGSGSGLAASSIIKTLERRDLFIATDLPEVCKFACVPYSRTSPRHRSARYSIRISVQ